MRIVVKPCIVIGGLFLLTILTSSILSAQDLKTPVGYLNYIGDEYSKIARESWDYTKAIAHSKSAKKVEKRRLELLKTVGESRRKIGSMPSFNKNTSYRDSVIAYLRVNYHVINEDYAKIVDMEEVAEQSYDQMEAYLLAKEKASEKLANASERVQTEREKFALDNNVKLLEGEESKLGQKMKKAGEVFDYYNYVYLIFFKSYKQENYLIEALNTGDISSIEQNRNALLNYSQEGKDKVRIRLSFKGDETLSNACQEMLNFYISEAKDQIPLMVNFFSTKDKFNKIKTAFDAIKPAQRTQENIDQYNKAIDEMNKASNKYNEVNSRLNTTRTKLLDNWNKKSDSFLDRHVP